MPGYHEDDDLTTAWEEFSADNYGRVIISWDELPPDSQEAFKLFRREQRDIRAQPQPKKQLKMSPCDEDVRMFVIAQFGIKTFTDMVAADPRSAERTLDNLVHFIRTGKAPR